jgi:uncharacterized protein
VAAERFDLRTIAPQPWKNGCGLTHEIAIGPRGADASNFDWRFSVAEVRRAAPFSAFPGVDRCIVLLAGGGMHLRSDDGMLDHRLVVPLAPFHFPGELALWATPIGGPSSDFNAMTRRGVLRCVVTSHDAALTLPVDGITLLLCCGGDWHTDDPAAPTLAPMQGLLWRGADARHGPAAIRVAPPPRAAAAQLLFVRLCHDAAHEF